MEVKGLIARKRGEVIVRHWQDEVDELKKQHSNELAQKDVMLEEQRRLMGISNQKLVELEERLRKYGSCIPSCDKWWSHPHEPMEGVKCTCGWEEG